MRVLYCFVGAAGVACCVATGCSSSSNHAFGNDASTSPPVDGSIQDAAPACVPIPGLADADLSPLKNSDAATAPCSICLLDQCAAAVNDCKADCLCGTYFVCVAYEADAGIAAFYTCAGDAGSTLLSNTAFVALGTCTATTCKAVCLPATDGGDASSNAGDASSSAGD